MASSKGPSNSNKTAHVMNLLRKSAPAPVAEKPTETAPAAPVPANPQVPPIVTSLNADAEISAHIKDALETALAEDLAADPAVSAPEPTQEEVQPFATPNPAPVVSEPQAATAPSEEVPVPDAPTEVTVIPPKEAPIPENLFDSPAAQVVSEAPESAASVSEAVQPDEPASAPAVIQEEADPSAPVLQNVMLQLAEERAEKYMKMFGLCQCARCKSDVLALALNNLTPRYVVMPASGLSPRLDMYGNRFNSEITAQLLHACKIVMEHPRHDQPSN